MTQDQSTQTNGNDHFHAWQVARLVNARHENSVNLQLLRRMHLN